MHLIGTRIAADEALDEGREPEGARPDWLEELDDYEQPEVLALPLDSEIDEVLEARGGRGNQPGSAPTLVPLDW